MAITNYDINVTPNPLASARDEVRLIGNRFESSGQTQSQRGRSGILPSGAMSRAATRGGYASMPTEGPSPTTMGIPKAKVGPPQKVAMARGANQNFGFTGPLSGPPVGTGISKAASASVAAATAYVKSLKDLTKATDTPPVEDATLTKTYSELGPGRRPIAALEPGPRPAGALGPGAFPMLPPGPGQLRLPFPSLDVGRVMGDEDLDKPVSRNRSRDPVPYSQLRRHVRGRTDHLREKGVKPPGRWGEYQYDQGTLDFS